MSQATMNSTATRALAEGGLTVAIAGGTGNIAFHRYKRRLRFRQALEKLGYELIVAKGPLQGETLKSKSVDVLVSFLGHDVPMEEKDALYEAAINSGVKVYFPTEYGV
ncbi:hypothetical protein FRB96_006960 [Tulasnella sp. 330]|nr:hypothetical protein FRB96_006960 [Tulasnella sp. 330]